MPVMTEVNSSEPQQTAGSLPIVPLTWLYNDFQQMSEIKIKALFRACRARFRNRAVWSISLPRKAFGFWSGSRLFVVRVTLDGMHVTE